MGKISREGLGTEQRNVRTLVGEVDGVELLWQIWLAELQSIVKVYVLKGPKKVGTVSVVWAPAREAKTQQEDNC